MQFEIVKVWKSREIQRSQLYRYKRGTFNWDIIETTSAFPDVKQGIAEEVIIMLDPELEKTVPLVTIEKAAEYTKLAEEILGYKSGQSNISKEL
ncbi:hypothetical protein ACFL0H_15360 [Thermodesulfobacteriota bacterium]